MVRKAIRPNRDARPQRDAFIETAREHGADMTEAEFKKAMGKIAKGKTSKPGGPAK